MPKVSIIVPIYNVETYVGKTIESLVNQSEKDIEIILVDDGSKDQSGKVCDEYAVMDERIKVIHKQNGGLSSARNVGVEAATADYIQFVDGDDYLAPCAVERLLEVADIYPSDFIQFRYREVYAKDIVFNRDCGSEIYQAHTSKELFENLYRLGGVAASGCTKLIKKNLLQKIPFESIRHEDEMWCTRAFSKPLLVTYINDELYYYVIRENSIIHSDFTNKKLEIFTVLEERIKTLNKLALNDYIELEYKRIFFEIIRLYCEALNSHSYEALKILKEKFKIYRDGIAKSKYIKGKYKILYFCMQISFLSINLYYRLRKNR